MNIFKLITAGDEVIFLGTEDFIEFSKLQDTDKLNKIDFITSKFHELGQEWNDQDKNGEED